LQYESLESVKALRKLHEAIGKQLDVILTDARESQEAAQGTLFLLRVLSMSTEVVADGNPRAPHFARMDTKGRKVGGDNPDAEYDVVKLDGRIAYRVRGNVGSVRHLSLTFNAGMQGRRSTFAYLNERGIETDDAGNFTLILAANKSTEEGTWIETPAEPYSVLVRQFIASREKEALATYDIEVLGEGSQQLALEPHSDAEIAANIRSACDAFQFMTSLQRVVHPELFETPHVFIRANSDELGADISGTDNLYMFATFDLGSEEALVVDVEPLREASYWNLCVMTRFHEIIDYLKRPTSRTSEEVTPERDGTIRFVLTHGLPLHPNWLDTAGHRYGILLFRWVGPRDAGTELPEASVVAVSELEGFLAKGRP
jgi:hypothetical protein